MTGWENGCISGSYLNDVFIGISFATNEMFIFPPLCTWHYQGKLPHIFIHYLMIKKAICGKSCLHVFLPNN